MAIVLAPRRALDTTGVLGRTGNLSRAALVVMSLQELGVPTSGPAGAVPVRVRSRSSAGLRWTRGRLWHPRRQHRPLRTGPGSGDRCEGRRFAPLARRIYVPGILSSQPSQVCPPAHGTVPERRANVQKGARPRGTDRRYSVPFRGSAGRRKDAGTRWLGCCPPEMSTGETHPRAKRPMNRAKTPLQRNSWAQQPSRRLIRTPRHPAVASSRPGFIPTWVRRRRVEN